MDKSVFRQLDALQQLADKNRPCKITITFADGSKTVTDPAGAINIFRDMGPFGAIANMEADRPEYDGLISACTLWPGLSAAWPLIDYQVKMNRLGLGNIPNGSFLVCRFFAISNNRQKLCNYDVYSEHLQIIGKIWF